MNLVSHYTARRPPAPIVQDRRITAYEILGLNPTDDYPVIASAWRQLSDATHPDKIGHERFEEYYLVQHAYYDIFNDPRRCSYDRSHGIRGLWTDRSKECNEIARPYFIALSQKDKERQAKVLEERFRKRRTREGRTREADGPSRTWNVDKDNLGYWDPRYRTAEDGIPEDVEHAEKELGTEPDNDLRPGKQDSVPTPPKIEKVLTSQDFGMGVAAGRLAYWLVRRVAL